MPKSTSDRRQNCRNSVRLCDAKHCPSSESDHCPNGHQPKRHSAVTRTHQPI
ncbi:hypothetical protein PCANC_21834 [Puccinia coronata f. sp. avenae]|uniref:Uncharacterized protein n=1 Tax=Puccinia coronata f. sp. avenae TaxID=200324 RepID=A0A2N5S1K8_9BASI|nr:hypothetical protein PCANC_21834 [Puccinia coronata f. sp. avenae]